MSNSYKVLLSNLPIQNLPRNAPAIKREIISFLQPFPVKKVILFQNPTYIPNSIERKYIDKCCVDLESDEQIEQLILSDKKNSKLKDVPINITKIDLNKFNELKKTQNTQKPEKSEKEISNVTKANTISGKKLEIIKEDISPSPIADIGLNLSSKRFSHDWKNVLIRSSQANVKTCIVTGCTQSESARVVSLIQEWRKNPSDSDIALYSTVGIHPHNSRDFNSNTYEALKNLVLKNKDIVKAIGETGLDYNRMFSTKEQQIASFESHIKLAIELQLPMFLHEREAHEDFVKILLKYKDKLPKICVHCFTGNEKELQTYLKLGFYIGFTGFINNTSRSGYLHEAISKVPLDRIMIETDAPFMIPFKASHSINKQFSGRCEPFMLVYVLKFISEILNEKIEVVAKKTFENTKEFFNI